MGLATSPLRHAGAVSLAASLLGASFAASAQQAVSPFADRLTGDWNGSRLALARRGISIDVDATLYYQGVESGTGNDGYDFGSRFDLFPTLDTGKLGWWERGFIRAHVEYRTDDLDPTLGGTLMPTSLGVRLPADAHDWTLSSLHLVQRIGERSTLIAGKINTVDLLAGERVFGGYGVSRFGHLAFAAPINGLTPPVIMGGILKIETPSLGWTLMLYDANDRTRDSFDDLFGDGVNVSVGATHGFEIGGRASSVNVSTIYSTKEGIDLGDVLLPPELETGVKSDSWHVSAQFNHALWSDAAAGRSLAFSIKGGLSDGNPNPYERWVTTGLAGTGLFAARPRDGYGIGAFHYRFSTDLRNALVPLARFGDEYGLEAFYDATLAAGLTVGANLQWIEPTFSGSDRALTLGLRARLRF